jgi:hypothetical protein
MLNCRRFISLIQAAGCFALLEPSAIAEPRPPSSGVNDLIVALLQSMPVGGGYSADAGSARLLGTAVALTPGGLSIRPEVACPSYCAGATYLVFLRLLQRVAQDRGLDLNGPAGTALLIRGQRDGEGIWGRWNANGPGTARLFHELGLGPNFIEFAAARPGDFMKIFWSSEVGRAEHGHSVIYLGREVSGGVERVRFWSSNKPGGYSEKTVPRSRIVHAIFSRLERPENLLRAPALPELDPYLASLLTVRSSFTEACEKVGCRP